MLINKNAESNRLAIERGRAENHILAAGDFLPVVQPFIDLAEASAEVAHARASKVIGTALREKALMEATARESAALFSIAELIRKLEMPPEAGLGKNA